jgi:hypothetical protein
VLHCLVLILAFVVDAMGNRSCALIALDIGCPAMKGLSCVANNDR